MKKSAKKGLKNIEALKKSSQLFTIFGKQQVKWYFMLMSNTIQDEQCAIQLRVKN